MSSEIKAKRRYQASGWLQILAVDKMLCSNGSALPEELSVTPGH